jgi:hypothetical protein
MGAVANGRAQFGGNDKSVAQAKGLAQLLITALRRRSMALGSRSNFPLIKTGC